MTIDAEATPGPLAPAVALREAGRHADAMVWLSDRLAADDTNVEAWLLLSHVALLKGDDRAAATALDRARALAPAHPRVALNVARLASRRQKRPEALAAAQAAVAQAPRDREAHLVLGGCLSAAGRQAEALGVFDALIRACPDYAEAYAGRALARAAAGEATAAIEDADRAAAIKPALAVFHALTGKLRFDAGLHDAAAEAFGRARAITPEVHSYAVDQGECLRRAGRHHEAVAALDDAVRLAPQDARAWASRAGVLQSADRTEAALEAYDTSLALSEKLESGFAALTTQLGGPDNPRAAGFAAQAATVRAQISQARVGRAVVLKTLRRANDAEADCRRALEHDPDNAAAWFNLAGFLADRGELNEAQTAYARALAPGPDRGVYLVGAAHHALYLNDGPGARRLYEAGRDAGNPAATVALAILAYLADDPDEARRLIDLSRQIRVGQDAYLRNSRVYWTYLDRLLSRPASGAGASHARPLEVIGESHVLGAHGVVVGLDGASRRCRSHWVMGTKLWRLGRSRPNVFKHRFRALIDDLPAASDLLVVVGEIDCRLEEGVLDHLRRTPGADRDQVIATTVRDGVAFVAAATAAAGHRVILQGVPCPHLKGHPGGPDLDALVDLIAAFNIALRTEAAAAGFAFLDVHALTDTGGGRSDGRWHIDNHHLIPEATTQAFERHLHRP